MVPAAEDYDFYGSTENPIMAAQIDQSVNGLSMTYHHHTGDSASGGGTYASPTQGTLSRA